MKPLPMTPTVDQVLHHLKTRGPQTAMGLAKALGVTPMAIRQHLGALSGRGHVEFTATCGRVGRPARHWRLTEQAAELFPDSHAELSVGLIQAARAAFGEAGIERLIQARTAEQVKTYRARLPPAGAPLAKRVAALAAIRSAEGYLAESSRAPDGSLLLVENHCPICAAARACQGICGGELELFRRLLGRGVEVDRVEHILQGERRCAYRIRERA